MDSEELGGGFLTWLGLVRALNQKPPIYLESTSPRSPWLRGRGYEGCNTWVVTSVESKAGPHVCGHPHGQSEKRGGQGYLREFP